MNNTIKAAKDIDSAAKTQSSQALIIQTYANSILEQPTVDFSGFKGQTNGDKLVSIGDEINKALGTAQAHAKTYLNSIQPTLITNVSNIEAYYDLHQAVATTLPPGSSKQQWISTLTALASQSSLYKTTADGIVVQLQTLHDSLTDDSAAFAKLVSDLNALVDGDNGVLASINDQLDTIQSKIDGAIAGIVLSGLAIVGGVFIAAVGGIADFVTAGASTPVLLGGIAIVAAGVGGEVASAVTLANLNSSKANLLTQKAQLEAEVKLATGMSSAYGSFNTQVKAAATASTQMANAWGFLGSDLGNLANDLNQGIKSPDAVRSLFLTAANSVIKTVDTDISTIKRQLTGVQAVTAPKGQTISDFITQVAHKHTA